MITTAEGHELLATAADILNSPRTRAGKMPPNAGTPQGPPIPEWAMDPDTPAGLRPTAGFSDLGIVQQLDPAIEMSLPGERIEEALTRQRARRLHQFFLDSVRMATSTKDPGTDAGAAGEGQMPLAPHFTVNVTLDLETFLGRLDAAGVTDHGNEISAARLPAHRLQRRDHPHRVGRAGSSLELGRSRRYFNRAQRRAIAVRDKGCINPGCTMWIGRSEAHHLDEWNRGGRPMSPEVACCAPCAIRHTTQESSGS